MGTIVAVAIASKMLVETKLSRVSCQPNASCADSSKAESSGWSYNMPAPGWMRALRSHASAAATAENPSIHLNVRKAILPVPVPVIEPVATITDAITSGTIDIWMRRMNRSPMNLRLAAQSPTSRPKTIPPIAPIPIWIAG